MMGRHALFGAQMAIVFALVVTSAEVCPGQAQPATPDAIVDSRIELSGRVTDESQNAISRATVTLIAATHLWDRQYADFDPRRAWLEVETDEQGRFQLGFASTDQRFLVPGDSLLLVRASGFQAHLREVPMARMQVDVPVEVQLDRSRPVDIDVVGPDGHPVPKASVFPASLHGLLVPWAVARKLPVAITDSRGRCRLDFCSPGSLDGVFVTAPKVGNQRLPVSHLRDGRLQARTMVTRAIDGQISSPGLDAVPGIGGVRMFVVTRPPARASILNQPIQSSWAIAAIDRSGQFQVAAMGVGELSYSLSCQRSFPFREPYRDQALLLEAGTGRFRWKIEFQKQAKLIASVIDAQTSAPLPNIYISSWDGRLKPIFTNANGQAEFYRTFDDVAYFPQDPLGEHFQPNPVYRGSDKLPDDNGQIVLESVALTRSSSRQGRVVDEHGRAVAGARVEFEYVQKGFTRSDVAYSNSMGRFRLTGVADQTALELRAVKEHSASKLVSVVWPPSESFLLTVVPKPVATPNGRIVDLRGKPIAGVGVTLKRATVFIKGYGCEELHADDLYRTPIVARTDILGRFKFPATIDYAQRLQLQVCDEGYFPYYSPFVDGSKIGTSGQDADELMLDLGDFRVMRRPDVRAVTLLVESSIGEPVANAEIVIVGARTGTTRGSTDEAGSLRLDVRHGKAVIAVRSAGHAVYFAEMPVEKTSLRIVLPELATRSDLNDNRSIWSIDKKEFASAAQRIFASVELPDPNSTTYHRLRTYVGALAVLNPDEFIQYVQRNSSKSSDLEQIGRNSFYAVLACKPDLIESAIENSLIADDSPSPLITAAMASEDQDFQNEWLAEALVKARGLSGEEQLYALAGLARVFLTAGRVDLAKQIAVELWSNAPDLQAIVRSGVRQEKIGESRLVGPIVALIDLERARRLISLTGTEIEIPRLHALAQLDRWQAFPEELVQQLNDHSFGPLESAGFQSWLSNNTAYPHLPMQGLPAPDRVASLIDDAKTRLRFLVYHARITTNRELRRQLLEVAADAIRRCEATSSGDHYSFHYTSRLLPELRLFRDIDPDSLDLLIFSTLWNLPQQFEGDRLQTVLGGAAQIIALRDRRLARTLIEPALQDRGWLFMGRQSGFGRNKTLNSVARIDPDWSVELVDVLCKEELRHNPVDQLELRCGMVRALLAHAK